MNAGQLKYENRSEEAVNPCIERRQRLLDRLRFTNARARTADGCEPLLGMVHGWTSMKAHELLNCPEVWCQESPAEDGQGNKLQAHDPPAKKWGALAAIQKVYPP